MIITPECRQAAKQLQQIKPGFQPKIAMVLGSGLGALVESLQDSISIPYGDLPGLHACTVSGHQGCLHLGHLMGTPVMCFEGRPHLYEGIGKHVIPNHIHLPYLMGCETILITNAAGSLVKRAQPGSLMIIKDHINFTGSNPLLGRNDDSVGPRFLGMETVYNKKIREELAALANDLDIPTTEGVYFGVSGPTFETPAEVKAFQTLGAEAVGMSTVHEVIIAHHCGLKVAVISVITNAAAGLSDIQLTHDVTLNMAKKGAGNLIKLCKAYVGKQKT